MLSRAEIDDILRLIDTSAFQEMKLEMGDLKLELRKGGAAPSAPPPPLTPFAPVTTKVTASGGGSEVPSPLLGTFWHAPRPGADPFVKPGDVVTPDTVIGIIEVMKLMNSVSAGIGGTVVALVELVAPNGELVEHGQTLIRIQPQRPRSAASSSPSGARLPCASSAPRTPWGSKPCWACPRPTVLLWGPNSPPAPSPSAPPLARQVSQDRNRRPSRPCHRLRRPAPWLVLSVRKPRPGPGLR